MHLLKQRDPDTSQNSSAKLRGHHLICLFFYSGEGYSADFIQNLVSVIQTAESAGVIVTEGADDICSHCPSLRDNICRHSEYADEEVREMDATALRLLGLSSAAAIDRDEISRRLPAIFSQWHKMYCSSCEWKQFCEKKHYLSQRMQVSQP